jgi:hypothetical protein
VSAQSRGMGAAVAGICLLLSACVGAPLTTPPTPTPATIPAATTSAAPLPSAEVQTVAVASGAGFASPTGHIVCLMGSDGVRCEFHGTKSWKAPRPDGCELDWDSALALGDQLEGVCAGDTIMGFAATGQGTTAWWKAGGPTVTVADANMTLAVLPYDSALAVGRIRCDSASTGVTCRNLTTGHGFSMAAEAYATF